MHFNFKHVCTHSLGEFVHIHLEGLVELVHIRSVDCVTRTTQNRTIWLISPCSLVTVLNYNSSNSHHTLMSFFITEKTAGIMQICTYTGHWWIYLSVAEVILEEYRYPSKTHHNHDDVIKWKHFPRNCPFVWGIHRSPVNSPHKGQCRGVWCFLWPAPEQTVE